MRDSPSNVWYTNKGRRYVLFSSKSSTGDTPERNCCRRPTSRESWPTWTIADRQISSSRGRIPFLVRHSLKGGCIAFKKIELLFLHAEIFFFQKICYMEAWNSPVLMYATMWTLHTTMWTHRSLWVARWVAWFVHQNMGLTTTCVLLPFSSCGIPNHAP